MFGGKGRGADARRQSEQGEKPYRDLYDWLMFAVGAIGVIAIVATLWLTYSIAADNSRDTAKAIANMSRIAGTLETQQRAIIDQSKATEKLASDTHTVAIATENQAKASATSATTAQQQLVTANKQLSQNIDLFAAQHRPIMALDLLGAQNHVSVEGDYIFWSFDFKNVGVGPAYNVFYYEAISINGGPFQELRRLGSRMDPPQAEHWSTAAYSIKPGDVYAKPTLRVRFIYSDILGKKYEDTACVVYEGVNQTRDCTEPQATRRQRKAERL